MACTIDHLSENHRVTVLQDFVDAQGHAHQKGETGLIRRLALELKKGEIVIEWERNGTRETLRFSLAARTGPGNGRMKDYFAIGEREETERPGKAFVPQRGYVSSEKPDLPAVTGELIQTNARFDEAIAQIHALAGRHRFDEAERQFQALLAAPDRNPGTLPRAAGAICGLAFDHAFCDDGAVYSWFRDRGLRLWYAWGSEATSGGEGASRAGEIHAVDDRFAAIDRDRVALVARQSAPPTFGT